MSEIKVNSIKGVGASAAAITVNNSDGTCTANLSNRQGKNLIINGAQLIAQRGVDATGVSANGFATVDRFTADQSGTDEYIEQHQVDVSSGTTPYTLGFRKAFQVKNGNQSSGAGTSDRVTIAYKIEAQDMANSGWNYNSASSFVTFSYWVKSSVAQNFYNRFKSADSPSQAYVTETGSLSADTWTKITKTISGNSNIVFNNDNGEGLEITWELFRGTSQTGTRPLNAWATSDNNTRTPDQTSTWYTTNDATFEITGVQLEVGSVATDFEHRSFGQELALCQRYFYQINGNNGDISISGGFLNASEFFVLVDFPVTMRATPSYTGSATAFRLVGGADSGSKNLNNLGLWGSGLPTNIALIVSSTSGGTTGYSGAIQFQADNGFLQFSAEL